MPTERHPAPLPAEEVTVTWNTHVGRGLGAGRRRNRWLDLRRNAPHALAFFLQEVPDFRLLRRAVGDRVRITPEDGHGRPGAFPYVVTDPRDGNTWVGEVVRPVPDVGKHPRAVVAQLLRRRDGSKLALLCFHAPPLGKGVLRSSVSARAAQDRYLSVVAQVKNELVADGFEVRMGGDLNQSIWRDRILPFFRRTASGWRNLSATGVTWAHQAVSHGHLGLDDVGTTRESRVVRRRTVRLFGPHPAVVVRTRRVPTED